MQSHLAWRSLVSLALLAIASGFLRSLCLILLHRLHLTSRLLTQIVDCSRKHTCGRGLSAHDGIETNHHLCHSRGHISAAAHALPPREGTILVLEFLQESDILVHLLFQGIRSRCQARSIVDVLGIHVQGLLDMAAHGVGIDGSHQGECILLGRITDSWQRLHHQPTRIVGVLDGYLCLFSTLRLLALLVQEEFAQVEVLLTLLMQGDRQGVHHEFTVAQNRQIVLFTIAVAITGSHHLINIYAFFQSLDIKGDGSRALGINAVVLCLLPNHLVGLRVKNLHTGVTAHLLVGRIEEFHHDGALIALTQEARHVRLHHHGLLSHSLIHQQTVAHLLVMSQAHELPGSHALRQGKPDGYVAIVVALQGRIEEGGLVHILTHLHLVEELSCI